MPGFWMHPRRVLPFPVRRFRLRGPQHRALQPRRRFLMAFLPIHGERRNTASWHTSAKKPAPARDFSLIRGSMIGTSAFAGTNRAWASAVTPIVPPACICARFQSRRRVLSDASSILLMMIDCHEPRSFGAAALASLARDAVCDCKSSGFLGQFDEVFECDHGARSGP